MNHQAGHGAVLAQGVLRTSRDTDTVSSLRSWAGAFSAKTEWSSISSTDPRRFTSWPFSSGCPKVSSMTMTRQVATQHDGKWARRCAASKYCLQSRQPSVRVD